MLQFLKYVLATIVGFFLFMILSLVLLAGIGSAFSNDDAVTDVKSNSVLNLNLNAVFTEMATKEDAFSDVFGQSENKISVMELKKSINNAKLDPNIKAISIRLEMPSAGFAQIEEIRNALIDFKKSGKKVYTYGEVMTEKAVYLSSVATKSFINPTGGIEFNGLDTEIPFMKGLFEKIGVKPLIFKVGDFKSAVEPFIRTDMSPENKLQVNEYLGSIANHMYGNIAAARGITKAEVDNILNNASIQEPEDAVKYKILTNVGYEDEYENAIKADLGLKTTDKISYVKLGAYKSAKNYLPEGSRDNRIAVISSEGDIESGDAETGTIASETFISDLRKAVKDKKVKAIVLRINSPGGSALASDVMWREIQLAKKIKPVIASMGDVAASGGYYMAMGCDTIVAQPTTITGSIGIFGMLFNTQELMNSKLGVTFDGVKTHQYADSPSLTHTMNDAEKMMIQNSVNKGYEKFTSKAALGRRMNIDKLKSVASGRVWTGAQAKQNGLVDVLGGIDEAIAIAAKKAKLSAGAYQVKNYPIAKSDIERFMAGFNKKQEDAKLQETLGALYPLAKEYQRISKMEKIQACLPYTIDIH